jgi:ribosomal protein L37E
MAGSSSKLPLGKKQEVVMLSFRNEPLHYRIFVEGLIKEEPFFAIDIANLAVKRLGGEIKEERFAELTERVHFNTFQGKLEHGLSFGFDGVGTIKVDDSGNVRLEFPLPVVEQETGICERCDGRKTFDAGDDFCAACGGAGKHFRIERAQALAISATCTMVFAGLNQLFAREESSHRRSPFQLFRVRTEVRSGPNGYPVHGEFSAPLVKWLAAQEGDKCALHFIPTVLMLTHLKMRPLTSARHRPHKYRVVVGRKGWLDLAFPGDGCGLHPAATSITENVGYQFTSRNVDEPWQQIALLIALGTMTDAAMEERVHERDK